MRLAARRVFSVVAYLSLGAVIASGVIYWITPKPQTAVTEFETVSSNLLSYEPGRLNILEDRTRRGSCVVLTARWLGTYTKLSTGEVLPKYVPIDATSAVPLLDEGEHRRYILSLPMPDGLYDGDWFYFSRTSRDCPSIKFVETISTTKTSDIPVRIRSGAIVPMSTP